MLLHQLNHSDWSSSPWAPSFTFLLPGRCEVWASMVKRKWKNFSLIQERKESPHFVSSSVFFWKPSCSSVSSKTELQLLLRTPASVCRFPPETQQFFLRHNQGLSEAAKQPSQEPPAMSSCHCLDAFLKFFCVSPDLLLKFSWCRVSKYFLDVLLLLFWRSSDILQLLENMSSLRIIYWHEGSEWNLFRIQTGSNLKEASVVLNVWFFPRLFDTPKHRMGIFFFSTLLLDLVKWILELHRVTQMLFFLM